jgi:hypothetical protein
MDTVSVWVGYGYTFIPMGSTHTLYNKLWVGHGYSLLPAGIPMPYPFILACGFKVFQKHLSIAVKGVGRPTPQLLQQLSIGCNLHVSLN